MVTLIPKLFPFYYLPLISLPIVLFLWMIFGAENRISWTLESCWYCSDYDRSNVIAINLQNASSDRFVVLRKSIQSYIKTLKEILVLIKTFLCMKKKLYNSEKVLTFSRAFVTEDHTLGDLKTTKMCCPTVLEASTPK